MSSQTITRTARRLVSRTSLIAAIVLASLGALAAVVLGAMNVTLAGLTSYQVPIVEESGTRPNLSAPADLWYSSVHVVPHAPDPLAVGLESIAIGSRAAIAGLACVVIIVLAAQLLRRRSFGRGSALVLGALGAAMLVVAIAAPMLEAQAVAVAMEALGLPTVDHEVVWDNGSAWLVTPAFDAEDVDWSLLALGLVAGLASILLTRATRLQEDAEGLI